VNSGGEPDPRSLALPGPLVPLGVGLAALAVCALYGLYSPASFFRAYLIAFLVWLGVSLGGLALVAIGHLTGGAWAAQVRPVLGPAARVAPAMALIFLPLLLGLHLVYPWADAAAVAADAELRQKTIYYLNLPGFLGRAAFYFLVWTGAGFLIAQRRPQGAMQPSEEERRRLGLLSAVSLALFGFTITFASIDWSMSIEPEPRWFSTIYGAIFGVGMILTAFAFAIAVVCRFNPAPERQVLRDLGNLLLAFTMVWMYLQFSQYLLIWSGNLREEIPWYVRRSQDVWCGMALVLVLLQFAVPFALLLSPTVKENPRALMGVAALVFAMRFVDLFWMIAPAFGEYGDLFWLYPLAVVGVGGLWVSAFLWMKPTTTPAAAPEPVPVGGLAHD
jgi:hypothetical protein